MEFVVKKCKNLISFSAIIITLFLATIAIKKTNTIKNNQKTFKKSSIVHKISQKLLNLKREFITYIRSLSGFSTKVNLNHLALPAKLENEILNLQLPMHELYKLILKLQYKILWKNILKEVGAGKSYTTLFAQREKEMADLEKIGLKSWGIYNIDDHHDAELNKLFRQSVGDISSCYGVNPKNIGLVYSDQDMPVATMANKIIVTPHNVKDYESEIPGLDRALWLRAMISHEFSHLLNRDATDSGILENMQYESSASLKRIYEKNIFFLHIFHEIRADVEACLYAPAYIEEAKKFYAHLGKHKEHHAFDSVLQSKGFNSNIYKVVDPHPAHRKRVRCMEVIQKSMLIEEKLKDLDIYKEKSPSPSVNELTETYYKKYLSLTGTPQNKMV